MMRCRFCQASLKHKFVSLGPSPLANSYIDEIYDTARQAGAVGGKLAGAGGGGMILLFVPPEKQAAVRTRLSKLIHVPIRFEGSGSQVIFRGQHQRYEAGEEWRTSSHTKFLDIKEL